MTIPIAVNRRGLVVALVCAASAACAKSPARVAVEPPPPLTVPAPPARIIVPPDPTPPPPVEEAPAPAPARPRPNRPAPPRPDAKAEVAKPEPEGAKPANGQDAPPPPPSPTLEMQPGDRGDAAVRHQLNKAQDDLKRVDYVALSNDLKAQYETAKRFITLGEQALREQNLTFAATLADKAGAIATLLLRR